MGSLSEEQVGMHRLGIYSFYDQAGHAERYVEFFLSHLTRYLDELVIVVNGTCDEDSKQMFEQYASTVMIRENIGLHPAAYQCAMQKIGWERLSTFDEIVCTNDSIMGPVNSFDEVFRRMSETPADFWGIVSHEQEESGSTSNPAFIEGSWHVYRRSLIASPKFRDYWDTLKFDDAPESSARNHDLKFTRYLQQLGFTCITYIDPEHYRTFTADPMLYMPAGLIRDYGCPIFRRAAFSADFSTIFEQTAGQPALELFDYLKECTSYDIDLMWEEVLRIANVDDIRKALHLTYVLPSRAMNPQLSSAVKSAFIFHIYFLDLLANSFNYIKSIPLATDLFITTTADKISAIKSYMSENGIIRDVRFITVENRGRDVSALLVGAKDVVLEGGYEIIGFCHDKKSSQNLQTGHRGSESQGFAYKLMENVLGSATYVRNVLALFADNPRLGMVTPPPYYNGIYYAHTRPNDWGPNFANTVDLVQRKLGLWAMMDAQKSTVSAIGSCYWFRVAALRPLFEANWSYKDFLPEGQMGGDGSISHAIERANGYIVQSQGYYPAWVLSERYASIEIDSLFYSTDRLLGAIGGYRRGETLDETCRALGTRVAKWRVLHSFKHKTHRLLQICAKYIVEPLPEGLKKVIYTVAWGMVNVGRKMIGFLRNRRG